MPIARHTSGTTQPVTLPTEYREDDWLVVLQDGAPPVVKYWNDGAWELAPPEAVSHGLLVRAYCDKLRTIAYRDLRLAEIAAWVAKLLERRT